ncbi:hypothetical protein T484DRAFT_1885521, partial [Baffinella frigidus]
MPFGHVRSQIWDIGMNGPWNDDTSVKQVTGKVGHPKLRGESAREGAARAREQGEFEQQVLERAARFKSILSRQDGDGDGRLSFDEFNRGLMELGVRLPEGEIKAIWGQQAEGSPWRGMEGRTPASKPDSNYARNRRLDWGSEEMHAVTSPAPTRALSPPKPLHTLAHTLHTDSTSRVLG